MRVEVFHVKNRQHAPAPATLEAEPELPPKVPEDVKGLERLAMLLGCISRGEAISKRVACELVGLCGAMPMREQAARWKAAVKELRREVAAEADPEAPAHDPTCGACGEPLCPPFVCCEACGTPKEGS